MSTVPATAISESANVSHTAPNTVENGLRWFELGLVLLVAFGGSLANSIYVLKYGPSTLPPSSNFRWIASAIHQSAGLALLGYVLHRRNLRFRDLGLKWSFRSVGTGFLLFLVAGAIYALGLRLIHLAQEITLGLSVVPPRPMLFFGRASALALLFALLNPFFEELIVRAYLMSEVRKLTGSVSLSVLLSVLLQSSYHLYYGWTGAGALAIQFLVFAVYYARTRNATGTVVAHMVFDVVGLAYLPR